MRKSSARSKEPYVKPVEHIELSEKHFGLRIVAFVVFLVLGVGALVYATMSLIGSHSTGWRTVQAGNVRGHSYDEELIFEYNMKNAVEYRQLQSLYASLLERTEPLFDSENGYEGINNIYYINRHINEQIVVDELLYSAFELLNEFQFRTMFTAPFYEDYRNIFFCDETYEAAMFDPAKNAEVKERADRISSFISDKNSIELQLLGKNTVTLYVSDEYKAYIESIGCSSYIDLWLVKNAFIIDYCADVITGSGYKGGRIYSYDGYIRNFDAGTEYTFQIFDYVGKGAVTAGAAVYGGVISAASLRDFPLSTLDGTRVFTYPDGVRKTDLLDSETCLDKTFATNLNVYSYGRKCAEVALFALRSFISDDGKLGLIERNGDIEYVYSTDMQIHYSEKDLQIEYYAKDPLYRK